MNKQQLSDFVFDTFSVKEDHPFENDFESSCFRHKTNKKWFALLMKVPKEKFELSASEQKLLKNEHEPIWVLNVKVDPMFRFSIVHETGIKPSYHMNKTHWVSVLISIASDENIKSLVEMSFDLTAKKISIKNKTAG